MRLAIILLTLLATTTLFSQTIEADHTSLPLNPQVATKYINSITHKFSKLQKNIEQKSLKALQRLQKQESKLQKQLAKKDSAAAKKLFEEQEAKYAAMQQKLTQTTNGTTSKSLKEYLPWFDTLKTSLSFLEQNLQGNTASLQQLAAAKEQLQKFESKMQAANEIKKQLKARKQQLQQQLQQYGMGKQLKQLKKETYYYQQQVEEYKNLLKDNRKLEKRAIAALKDNNQFKEFMKKNSLLAKLFKVPDNYGTPQSLAGLQTRANVQSMLNQRIAGGVANAQQQLQQQMQQAQNQLKQIKKKVNSFGSNSSQMDIPDFKPNSQKTKSFLKRIEYGLNFQTEKTRYFIPTTTDIALTVGYKLNDKSIIGIGGSYKLGWGKDIKNMQISHQGVSLRSYIDIRLKGSLWISGGYEQHYRHEFTKYEQLRDINAWQQSGLIGLTKKYKIGKKTHNLQLLWDFLSYRQQPNTQALKFRVGYVL